MKCSEKVFPLLQQPFFSMSKISKFMSSVLTLDVDSRLYARPCQAGECGGCNTSPHLLITTNFLKFVGILTKCVGKISWPNVVGKFRIFYHEKRNAEFFQYPVLQKSNFYRWWQPLKKLYKICTNNYDNNEYLAVKYIRFITNDIIWCL